MTKDLHQVALSSEDIFAIANSLNQEATKFEVMAELNGSKPNRSVLVWREHASQLRELSGRILAARKKRGK